MPGKEKSNMMEIDLVGVGGAGEGMFINTSIDYQRLQN